MGELTRKLITRFPLIYVCPFVCYDILQNFPLNLYAHSNQTHLGLQVCLHYRRGHDRKHITGIKENVVSYCIQLSMISGYIQHSISSVNASYDFRFKWDFHRS